MTTGERCRDGGVTDAVMTPAEAWAGETLIFCAPTALLECGALRSLHAFSVERSPDLTSRQTATACRPGEDWVRPARRPNGGARSAAAAAASRVARLVPPSACRRRRLPK